MPTDSTARKQMQICQFGCPSPSSVHVPDGVSGFVDGCGGRRLASQTLAPIMMVHDRCSPAATSLKSTHPEDPEELLDNFFHTDSTDATPLPHCKFHTRTLHHDTHLPCQLGGGRMRKSSYNLLSRPISEAALNFYATPFLSPFLSLGLTRYISHLTPTHTQSRTWHHGLCLSYPPCLFLV